jgi:hypothetical protein
MSTPHAVRNAPTPAAVLKGAEADVKQCSKDHEPMRWAAAHMVLSRQCMFEVVYSSGPTRTADKGIEHMLEALKVVTEHNSPDRFVGAQSGIARMYPKRVAGNRSENLSKGLAAAKTALRVSKNPCCPVFIVAELHEILGSIYADGDFESSKSRAANEDLAIRHCLAALQRTPTYSEKNADNIAFGNRQWEVGLGYYKRKNGNRRSNLKVAIKHFIETLKEFTKSKQRNNWAKVHQYLAMAYGELISTADPAASLTKMSKEEFAEEISALVEKWIASSKNALQVFSLTHDPTAW